LIVPALIRRGCWSGFQFRCGEGYSGLVGVCVLARWRPWRTNPAGVRRSGWHPRRKRSIQASRRGCDRDLRKERFRQYHQGAGKATDPTHHPKLEPASASTETTYTPPSSRPHSDNDRSRNL